MVETFLLDTTIFDEAGLFEKALASVPECRRKKVESFAFEKDRRLSLGAGLLLQYGLKLRGISQADSQLRYGPHGKAYLEKNSGLFFNIAHSGRLVICSFSEQEVGADVEEITPVKDSLIKRVCTEGEYHYLSSLDEEKKWDEFFRLWTAKESVIKYLGCGLSLAPNSFEVVFGRTLALKGGHKTALFFKEYFSGGYKITVCSPTNSFCEKLLSPRLLF